MKRGAPLGLAVLALWCAAGQAAEHAVKGRIVSMVPPTYDQKLRDADVTGDVRVVAVVGEYGLAVDPVIDSPHPELSDAVRDAMRFWFFQPPICVSGRTQYEARFTVAFTHEGAQYFVTIRDLKTVADGPSPEAGSGAVGSVKRIAGEDPRYPRKAAAAHRARALVVAMLSVSEQGTVDAVRAFSFPQQDFEEEVRRTLIDWRFEPMHDSAGRPKSFRACVQVNFKLQDR